MFLFYLPRGQTIIAIEYLPPVNPLEIVHNFEAPSMWILTLVSKDGFIVLGIHGQYQIGSCNAGHSKDTPILTVQVKKHFMNRQILIAT